MKRMSREEADDLAMEEASKELAYLLLAGFHYDSENACIYAPDWSRAFYDIYDAKEYLDRRK